MDVFRFLPSLLLTASLCAAGAAWASSETNAENPVVDPALRAHLAATLAQAADDGDRFDAEVWLLASDRRLQRYVDDPEERLLVLKTVYAEASRHKLEPDLVLAVMNIESHFDRYAVSRVGAQGLMQVMPFWRLELGRPQDNLTDIRTNIRYGTAILAHYLTVSKGDLVDALARYNGSRGRLKYPELVLKAWRKRWGNQTQDDVPALQASCTNYELNACHYQ